MQKLQTTLKYFYELSNDGVMECVGMWIFIAHLFSKKHVCEYGHQISAYSDADKSPISNIIHMNTLSFVGFGSNSAYSKKLHRKIWPKVSYSNR